MKRTALIITAGGALVVCALAPRVARAQSIGPEGSAGGRVQKTYPIQPFALLDWNGDLFATAKYRNDEVHHDSGIDTKTTDTFFEEGLDLRGRGYIYHPNLVDWNAAIRLGLSQQQVTNTGTNSDTDGTILGYDLSALILKEQPISLRLYADRNQSTLDRSFARPVDVTTEVEGGEVTYKSAIPVSLTLERRATLAKDDLRDDHQDILLGRLSVRDERSRDWRTSLDYEHEENQETIDYFSNGLPTGSEDQSYSSDELNFTNQWYWDAAPEQSSLTGRLRALDRSGFYEEQLLSVEERLDLAHSDTLASYYRALYSSDDTGSQNDQTLEGEMGVTEKFYKSLVMTTYVKAGTQDFIGGTQQTQGIYTDLDYTKQTPIGVLTSTLNLGEEWHQDQADSATRVVANESLTLTGLTAVTLSRPNVLPGTVVVTDPTHSITYVENVDYILQPLGTFTQIVRLAGGTIPDPGAVLVTYTVTGLGDASYNTDIIAWSVRLDFNWAPAAVYFDYRLRNDNLSSGTDPGYLDQMQSTTFGLEVRPLTGLRLTGEYEILSEQIYASYTAYRFRASYNTNFSPTYALAAGGSYEMLNYTNAQQIGLVSGEDFLETYGMYLTLTARVSDGLLVRWENNYTHQRGRDNNDLLSIGPSLVWYLGQTQISLDSYYRLYTQQQDHGQAVYAQLKLTRYF